MIFGASSSEMLPLPLMVTSRDAASWVLRLSLLTRALMLNLPTPPPKEAGAPEGSAETFIVTAGVDMRLRTVV